MEERCADQDFKSMTVYGVYRNTDMTEGRGPMVLDRLFLYEEMAQMYADSQLGVMGYKPKGGSWAKIPHAEWQVRPLGVNTQDKPHDLDLKGDVNSKELLNPSSMCEKCGAKVHRDDAMNRRCNDCERLVRQCDCV